MKTFFDDSQKLSSLAIIEGVKNKKKIMLIIRVAMHLEKFFLFYEY